MNAYFLILDILSQLQPVDIKFLRNHVICIVILISLPTKYEKKMTVRYQPVWYRIENIIEDSIENGNLFPP